MPTNLNPLRVFSDRQALLQLLKWVVALFVPVFVFTAWTGESIINTALLALFQPHLLRESFTLLTIIQLAVFFVFFYLSVTTLVGYLVAADNGQQSIIGLWVDILFFVTIPLVILIVVQQLVIGLALCLLLWAVFLTGKRLFLLFWNKTVVKPLVEGTSPPPRVFWIRRTPVPTSTELKILDESQKQELRFLAFAGTFWFSVLLSIAWLALDLGFIDHLPISELVAMIVRTLLLPVVGYALGFLSIRIALRNTLNEASRSSTPWTTQIARLFSRSSKKESPQPEVAEKAIAESIKENIEHLSIGRAQEKKRNLIPNPLPLRSGSARRFYLILLIVIVLLYPVLDPIFFGAGSGSRLGGYGDAGYYVILALGLNIVVGFAGLLDLGYVAFFAIGAYAWAMVGSPHFNELFGVVISRGVGGWIFWPMLIGAAAIAAFWGVVLGAPTLRLRGDYLAIVTLGFGEIIPIIFVNMRQFTNGTNGIVGVYSPGFPGLDWETFTPIPYYYLILVLIAVLIFVNLRLRDSRLGRAWVAIREDEIAAEALGVNLSRTKLWAFGAGAFFSGIAGMYQVAKLGTVSASSFHSTDSIIYLAMVVIGGLGSIPGVIVGAIVVYSLNQFILAQLDTIMADPNSFLHGFHLLLPTFSFNGIRNLIFGSILVLVMIYRPEGLIPSSRRRREFHDDKVVEEAKIVESEPLEAVLDTGTPPALAE